MPTLFLKRRRPELVECMEDASCDAAMLRNTYAQFNYVNRLIAGWKRVYRGWIKPRIADRASLLDVGCGGGDVAAALARWAARDGLELEVLAVDPDDRAFEYLRSTVLPPQVTIRKATTLDLVREKRRFDFVISNHLLHHMKQGALLELLEHSEELAGTLAVHNDIRRDDLAWAGFLPTALVFRKSFITRDGLTSIRKSFVPEELRRLVPEPWRVYPLPLFRNLLVWER